MTIFPRISLSSALGLLLVCAPLDVLIFSFEFDQANYIVSPTECWTSRSFSVKRGPLDWVRPMSWAVSELLG